MFKKYLSLTDTSRLLILCPAHKPQVALKRGISRKVMDISKHADSTSYPLMPLLSEEKEMKEADKVVSEMFEHAPTVQLDSKLKQ